MDGLKKEDIWAAMCKSRQTITDAARKVIHDKTLIDNIIDTIDIYEKSFIHYLELGGEE